MFSESSSSPLAHVVLLTVGFAFTGVGLWSGITSERLLKHGKTANGKITRLDWVPSTTNAGGSYFPEFSFTARDGSTHDVRSHDGTCPCPFKEGQSVVILYDPDDPSKAKIDTFGQMWLAALLFGIIGPLLLVCDFLYWLAASH
jgi:hypothetical protein